MVIYYTDGSCSPNPGPGGFAVILNGEPVATGNDKDSTNIRMEGKAIIAAMMHAMGQECEIRTDSQFWINVLTTWAPNWKAKNWTKSKGEIQNLDLVQEAFHLYTQSKAKLVWVKAHEGNKGNELADEWANKARVNSI